MILVDWIGSTGVFLILLAYGLNLFGRIETKDLSYILLNLFGAGIACVASVMLNYIPFVVLESAWVLVSLIALFRYYTTDLD